MSRSYVIRPHLETRKLRMGRSNSLNLVGGEPAIRIFPSSALKNFTPEIANDMRNIALTLGILREKSSVTV